MWFKNLSFYALAQPLQHTVEEWNAILEKAAFTPCQSQDKKREGFICASPHRPESLVQSADGAIFIRFYQEEKLLPQSVVRAFTQDQIDSIEATQGRKVGKRERKERMEIVAQSLLPRAFSRYRETVAFIDPTGQWLVVDAATPARAEALLTCLRVALPECSARLPSTELTPQSTMTYWLLKGESEAGFTLDDACELKTPVEDGAVIRCQKTNLDSDELRELALNRQVSKLGLTWEDQISFLLTETLQLKKVVFLGLLKDTLTEQDDLEEHAYLMATWVLMQTSIMTLWQDLLTTLQVPPIEQAQP